MPAWKKWLSYLMPVKLESFTAFNGTPLELCLKFGRLQLNAPNAIYSWDDLYTSFVIPFRELKICDRKPKTALILGYGTGSIAYLLKVCHKLDTRITGVDADNTLLELSRKYRPLPDVTLVHADAGDWISRQQDTFDLVCFDVYEDNNVPEQFTKTGFLEALKKLVRSGGLLLYSTITTSKDMLAESEKFFDNQFKLVFPEAGTIDLPGNLILFWENRGTG